MFGHILQGLCSSYGSKPWEESHDYGMVASLLQRLAKVRHVGLCGNQLLGNHAVLPAFT